MGAVPLRLSDNPYSFIVHTIISQMLSAKVASIIEERFDDLCGNDVRPIVVSSHTIEELKTIGISASKAKSIIDISVKVQNGEFNFNELTTLDDDEVVKKLTTLRGIGKWSAKMYLIFVLNLTYASI